MEGIGEFQPRDDISALCFKATPLAARQRTQEAWVGTSQSLCQSEPRKPLTPIQRAQRLTDPYSLAHTEVWQLPE